MVAIPSRLEKLDIRLKAKYHIPPPCPTPLIPFSSLLFFLLIPHCVGGRVWRGGGGRVERGREGRVGGRRKYDDESARCVMLDLVQGPLI